MKSKIKAIIFDLDGVLIDAVSIHYDAFNVALQAHGFTVSPEEHNEIYNGLPTIKKLELLTERAGLPPETYPSIQEAKQAHTRSLINARCGPDAVKKEMMSFLKKQGFELACCSNSIRATLDQTLLNTELLPFLDLTISCQEVPRPKPAPDIYTAAFERLEISPKESVVVEDSPIGVQSAEASGAYVCRVAGFEDVNADLVLNLLSDMPN